LKEHRRGAQRYEMGIYSDGYKEIIFIVKHSLNGFYEKIDELLTRSLSNIDKHYVKVRDNNLENRIMNVIDESLIRDF
jgi:hypothetical protein